MDSPQPPRARWVLHPPLLAAAFVLDIALTNEVEPAGFGRSLLVGVAAAVALTIVAWAVARERLLGGLIATTILLASISLLPVDAAWGWLRAVVGPDAAMAALGGALLVALAVPALLLVRARRGGALLRGPATSVLNRFSAVLVIVVVAFHVVPGLPGAVARLSGGPAPVEVNPPTAELPDIYVVLMDGYPRADVLARRFGIDNRPFIADLHARGFDVAEESRSNYVFTQVTLASMFQMRHIEEIEGLAPLVGTPGAHVTALRTAITSGPTLTALRAAGYQIVVNLPGYEHVALRGAADRVLDHGELNDLERELLARTWLLDLIAAAVPDVFAGPQHDRILNGLDDLYRLGAEARAEARAQPIFAWVHIPAPHLPLVVDVDGGTRPLEPRRFDPPTVAGFGLTDAELRAAYAVELSFLNARLLAAVEVMQDTASSGGDRPEPVIVVFSDHGYYYDETDTQARFANFLAASTPGAPGLLDGSPTPINLFPLLLNRYLGTDFALSEDRYFVSPGTLRLLELTEVPDPDAGGATP
jgi:hypothetical protein